MEVGRLRRRKAEKKGSKFTGVVYGLNQKMRGSKKYGAIRHVSFRVTEMGTTFMVHINERPFRQAHSMGDVSLTLINAFDQECIRAGIQAASPRTQAPPEMSTFQNPRH